MINEDRVFRDFHFLVAIQEQGIGFFEIIVLETLMRFLTIKTASATLAHWPAGSINE